MGQMFPDLVLTSPDKATSSKGIVEVETGESVNHLEAMAQWAHFGRVARALPSVCAGRRRRHRAPAVRGEPGRRRRNLELPHDRRPDPLHAGAAIAAASSREAAPRRRQATAASAEPAADEVRTPGAPGSAPKAASAKAAPRPARRREAARASARDEARRRGSSPATPALQPRSARLRNDRPRAERARRRRGKGSASSTGSARRPACASAARRSTRTPSACSSSTIPTSSSTGRAS